jgi:hypothetical protein
VCRAFSSATWWIAAEGARPDTIGTGKLDACS